MLTTTHVPFKPLCGDRFVSFIYDLVGYGFYFMPFSFYHTEYNLVNTSRQFPAAMTSNINIDSSRTSRAATRPTNVGDAFGCSPYLTSGLAFTMALSTSGHGRMWKSFAFILSCCVFSWSQQLSSSGFWLLACNS